MKNTINLLSRYPKILKNINYLIIGFYWLIVILWLIESWIKDHYNIIFVFSLEAAVFIFSIVVSGMNILLNKVIRELEYSPAHVLAIGYFNFISDVVYQLVANGIPQPKICIYRPTNLQDLSLENINLLKSQLTNAEYNVEVLNLTPKADRVRDVIVIHKDSQFESYFDIPKTLLSLYDYVEYKTVSKENSSQDFAKEKLTSKLISEFYDKLEMLIEIKDNLSFSNIDYCDRQMTKFLN